MERVLRVIQRQSPEEFSKTLAAQENLLELKIAEPETADLCILVEHQEVYTVGRSAPEQRELTARLRGADGQEIPWVEIGRGGKATFHGPGQLVAYPIVDLSRHGRDVHVYLRKLENAGIDCLKRFGLQAEARPGLTGIWLKNSKDEWKKIASIGIGVRKWVTYHGIAINVSTDLRYFQAITPCDQSGEVMTSLAEIMSERGQRVPTMAEVQLAFLSEFSQALNLSLELPSEPVPLPSRTRPDWLKVKAPGSDQLLETNEIVKKLKLVTVCEEARCPNMGECWTHRTATFMIMGELCTRRCSFCSVRDGTLETLDPLDPLEPYRVGKAVSELGLKHVVITSVNRDDLEDMGAKHFDQTVKAIKAQQPDCQVELLIPDMRGRRELVEMILKSGQVSVLNHNVETVTRLYRTVRPGAIFERSLKVLRWAKELHPEIKTKSGLMVGLGETLEEVIEVMKALRESNVDILTVGQYLQPTTKQLPIERYMTPEEFAVIEQEGRKLGFSHVESGPLVRSSYHAWKHVAPHADSQSDSHSNSHSDAFSDPHA